MSSAEPTAADAAPAAPVPPGPPPSGVAGRELRSWWVEKRWWLLAGAGAIVVAVIALLVLGGGSGEDVPSVRLTGGNVDENGRITIEYVTENFEPSIDSGTFHLHFFWNVHDPTTVGSNVTGDARSPFVEWDVGPSGEKVFTAFTRDEAPIGATAICAVVADADHAVHRPDLISATSSCIAL